MQLPFADLVIRFTAYFVLIGYLSGLYWMYYQLGKRYGESSFLAKVPWVLGLGVPATLVVLNAGRTVTLYVPVFVRIGCAVRMLFTVALVMFVVKINALRSYAVIELLFAIAVLVHTIGSITKDADTAQTLALLAGVYLLIRGMDNYKKDRDARTEALLAK